MKQITVSVEVHAPLHKTWKYWTEPEHIIQWNFASDEWECPRAENNLSGTFNYTMAAKDGSASFDFTGTYTKVVLHKLIEYTMEDHRKASITFEDLGDKTLIVETFEPETTNPESMQKEGWQAILNNFKKHIEHD